MPNPINNFAGVDFSTLKFIKEDEKFVAAVQQRINEAELCVLDKCSLAAVILYGSILEGLLFKYAEYYPNKFREAKLCPTKKGIPKEFSKWKFVEFIEVSGEIGILKPDIKDKVNKLRNFRNYVHIQEQIFCGDILNEDDADLSKQTLVKVITALKKKPAD